MGYVGGNDQDRFCSSSTPKLPLFSYSRPYETPGLATPPVNIGGSVPFLWEEAPGKPRKTFSSLRKPPKRSNLELPPRLSTAANEPSPTTVLEGPYDLRRRSLSLPRSAGVIRKLRGGGVVPEPAKEKKQSRWGSFGTCKEAFEGKLDFLRPGHGGCDCRCDWAGGGGGPKVKLYNVQRKPNLFHLSHAAKSDFWARVYQGFKQVIPWRRKQENLESTPHFFH